MQLDCTHQHKLGDMDLGAYLALDSLPWTLTKKRLAKYDMVFGDGLAQPVEGNKTKQKFSC